MLHSQIGAAKQKETVTFPMDPHIMVRIITKYITEFTAFKSLS